MLIRNIILIPMLAIMLAGTAWAEAKQDFNLTNRTGYVIDKVFVSPTHQESWESDVLGRDTLSDGETVAIHFSRSNKSCNWDLMVVYDDGEKAIWEGIDLCTVSSITIRWNKSTGVTSAAFD
ncbi:MAG: hypothetical protein H7833_01985 [Magnetococcus sp. DMHC-1]|nr:hypothetical protein [Magnetococcales bacterium]